MRRALAVATLLAASVACAQPRIGLLMFGTPATEPLLHGARRPGH
jgi:hypothetical protein